MPENKLLVAYAWSAPAVSTSAEVIILRDITTLPTARGCDLRHRGSSEVDEVKR